MIKVDLINYKCIQEQKTNSNQVTFTDLKVEMIFYFRNGMKYRARFIDVQSMKNSCEMILVSVMIILHCNANKKRKKRIVILRNGTELCSGAQNKLIFYNMYSKNYLDTDCF